MLGVREQFLGLRAAQPIDELLARHRRVVEQRGQQRPHLDAVGLPEHTEGLGILSGKARQRRTSLVNIFVDDDPRAVAEYGRLLHRRLDIGKAVAIKLEILDQRAMAHAHIEIGVQIEPEARQLVSVGAAAAADNGIALEHRDLHAGMRQISSERQTVVAGADDNSIETRHAIPGQTLARSRCGKPTMPAVSRQRTDDIVCVSAQKNAPARGAGAV